ncbi:late embryogenesis abundant protein 46 [Impatiens glandulifera]|uniref:late embryogenesis abundant protein 46 n=1 Tax=Impatiens glandulifera TaxID=253017 RepID=UPI001FB0ED0F|nr:late embryogenesis abundant protein 46 [Impatiens glandulifera]
MQSRDPMEKDMAARKKEERVAEAELRKLEERERAKYEHAAAGAGTGTTAGTAHLPTGTGGTHPAGTTRVGLGHNTRTGGAGTGGI